MSLLLDELFGKNKETSLGNSEGVSASNGLPTEQSNPFDTLVKSVTAQESAGNPNAVSKKGAIGLMQVMPETARAMAEKLGDTYSSARHRDPYWNKRWGAAYLQEGLDAYDGDMRFALARYHAGPKVDKLYENFKRTGHFTIPKTADYHDGDKYTADYVEDVTKRMESGGVSLPKSSSSPMIDEIFGTQGRVDNGQFEGLADLIFGSGRGAGIQPDSQPVAAPSVGIPEGGIPFNQSPQVDDPELQEMYNKFANSQDPREKALILKSLPAGHGDELIKSLPAGMAQPVQEAIGDLELEESKGDAFYGGLAASTPFSLFAPKDVQTANAKDMSAAPVLAGAGQITGAAAQAFMGGSLVSSAMSKIPTFANLANQGVKGKMAFSAIQRGVTAAGMYASTQTDELISSDKNIRKKALANLTTTLIGSLVSPIPEAIPGSDVISTGLRVGLQPVIDAVVETVGQGAFGENAWSKENLPSTLSQLAMSTVFALNDIKPTNLAGSGVSPKADTSAEQPRVNKMGSDAPKPGSEDQAQPLTRVQTDDEILSDAERAALPPVLRFLSGKDARKPFTLNRPSEPSPGEIKLEPPREMSEAELDRMWGDIEADRANLERAEALYEILGGTAKLDPKSFADAVDPNFVSSHLHLFKKGGASLDEAREAFVSDNRERLGDFGISEDDLQTPSQFGELIVDLATKKSMKDLRTRIANAENQFYDGMDILQKQRRTGDSDTETTDQKVNSFFDDEDMDEPWNQGAFEDRPPPKYSDQSEDLFKGTNHEDARSDEQRSFDQASQEKDKASQGKQQDDPFKGTAFDKSEQEAATTKQEDLFGGSGYASSGKYASRESGSDPARIELPELVELSESLTSGKLPKVLKQLSHKLASGLFRPGSKAIELRADLFKDVEQAEKTLAHEIGHAVDFLPEETMKRGNILGRVASLKKYGKKWMAGFKGGPEPLTKDDKSRLKKLAKEILNKPEIVDQKIEADTKYTPQQILDVWNSVGKVEPKLLSFIQGLNTAEKKSIVLEAMKGNVGDDVPLKAGTATEPQLNKPATPEEIAAKYRELILDETRKRQLLGADEIRQELKNLSMLWKPFDPAASKRYTKYRGKGEELYADAISVLLNEPKLLAEKAPNFYRGFFSYMDNKPEMKGAFDAIQGRIEGGKDAVLEAREKRITEGYEAKELEHKQEVADRQAKKRTEGPLQGLYRGLVEKAGVLQGVVRTLRKAGINVEDSKNPFLAYRSMPYVASKQFAYTQEAKNRVKDSLGWGADEKKLLGLFMQIKRAGGERGEIANPLGVGGKYADRQMEHLKKKLGIEKFKSVEKAAKEFADLRKEDVIPYLFKDDTFSKALKDKALNNDDYARFDVVKDFESKHGKQATASLLGMKSQTGTVKRVGNPFVETVTNDAILMRAKARNDLTRNTVDLLLKGDGKIPYKAELAETENIRGLKRFRHTENSTTKTVYFLKDGELQAYNIDRELGDLMTVDPVAGNGALNTLRSISNAQRALFIKYNLAFLARNPVRDIKAFAINIPKANLRKAIWYTAKAIPEVAEFVKTGKMSDDLRSAFKEGAMPVDRAYSDDKVLKADDGIERLMSPFGGDEKVERNWALRQMKKVDKVFEGIGQLQEKAVKLGGYKFAKEEMPELSTEARAQMVRSSVGTPDVYAGGTTKPLTNNLFIFSNANLQGIRASMEALKADPKRTAAKIALYEIAPKLIPILAGAGALSKVAEQVGMAEEEAKWLEEAYSAIPEHYKARYHAMPLPIRTESGKQVFVAIPTDHNAQTMGAIAYRMMNVYKPGGGGAVLKELADVSPISGASLQPVVEAAGAWWKWASGGQPIDRWRDKPVISERKQGAGKDIEAKEMAKWTWNELGGSIVYTIKDRDYDLRDKHWVEKMLNIPIASTPLSAYVKVSDKGISDTYRNESAKVAGKEKRNRLALTDKMVSHIEDAGDYSRSATRALYHRMKKDGVEVGKWSSFHTKYKNEYVNRTGSPVIVAINRAGSLNQREAVVEKYLDNKKITGRKRTKEKRNLMKKARLVKQITRELKK